MCMMSWEQNMKNSDYWRDRYARLEQLTYNMTLQSYSKIEKAFHSVQKELQNQIETWFYRIAKNNQISLLDAKQKLNKSEIEEFRWGVEEYILKARENAVNQKWVKQLENASARVHISQLQILQLHSQQLLEVVFQNQIDEVDDLIRRIYKETFYRSSYMNQIGLVKGSIVREVDERQLKSLIKKPWTADGREFSSRIWANKSQMVNGLHDELLKTLIRGGKPDEAIKNMKEYLNDTTKKATSNSARLIQTEQAYFSTVAKKESFKDIGLEQYQIVATFDLKTSQICREMDSNIFNVEDMKIGVNAPPFHPRCRTTTAPYLDINFKSTRSAKNSDGKTIQVDEDMTYSEWYELHGKAWAEKEKEKKKK